MIFCKELNTEFESKELLLKALIENKSKIKSLKKSAVKYSDGLTLSLKSEYSKSNLNKAYSEDKDNPTEIEVKVVMNTTNILDSHGDVHIDGIWKRTLSHSDNKLHLQEHLRTFDKVISSESKASVMKTSFKDLGFPEYKGKTEALVFNSIVKQARNPLMFDQYKNGYVTNHSVGMQYVDLLVCINSEEKWALEEKANWDKYYPMVANKEDADTEGYFWAVLEAKLMEGSAVLFGSNWVTPTLDNSSKNVLETPLNEDKAIESQSSTHEQKKELFINPNHY